MAHTPGPWIWDEDGCRLESPNAIADERGIVQEIVAVDMPEYITPADKALIVAAPDLLAALKRLSDLTDLPTVHDVREAWDMAHAAIKKAEGE